MMLWKWSLSCNSDPQMLQLSGSWTVFQQRLQVWCRFVSRDRQCVKAGMVENWYHTKHLEPTWVHHKPLMIHTELQNLLFVLMGVCLITLCYIPFFPFWKYNVYFNHWMLLMYKFFNLKTYLLLCLAYAIVCMSVWRS